MSITILTALIGILVTIFQQLGIEITSEKLQTTVEVIIQIVSFVVIWIRRYQAGGVNVLGGRKA